MYDETEELVADFVTESQEYLEEIQTNIIKLGKQMEDSVILGNIFKAFHTIKGNGAFLKLTKITTLIHKTENLLSALRENKISIDHKFVDTILSVIDILNHMMESIREDPQASEDTDIDPLLSRIEEVLAS